MKKVNTYQELSDLEIIAAYKENHDKKLIGELYKRYHKMVFGVCLKYLKQKTLAKDMVMNVFESLFDKVKSNKIEQFHSWLYVVTKNSCLMYLRKKKIQTSDFDTSAYKLGDYNQELLEAKKFQESVLQNMEQKINELKEEQKQCIQLFYLEQKSYEQIQKITGLPYKKVKSALQNGKRNLRILMSQE